MTMLCAYPAAANDGQRAVSVTDTTLINTSFEESESPAYSLGTINDQEWWSVISGSATIVDDTAYAHHGSRGLNVSTSSTTLRVQHTPFSGTEQGVTGITYFDMYVMINTSSGKEFTINGYDLFGTSLKRTFVIDFTIPASDTGSIRIYDGWHKVRIAPYQTNEWYRISGKVDYELEVYQVIVNGSMPQTVSFRESYTPTASGSRPVGIKEYHQLLFNLGAMDNTGSVDATVDDLYVGTYPSEGVTFPDPYITHTVIINQPEVGSISLEPEGPDFEDSTTVTATLNLPTGYMNYGWTGDLSGTELEKVLMIVTNMTIGADVGIDSLNPPPLYNIAVIQPAYGSISLEPDDSLFYEQTLITAALQLPSGYINLGWTGDLSGTELEKTFRILQDMTVGAEVVPDTTEPQTYIVSSSNDFRNAVENAISGDIIVVQDGVYDVSINMVAGGNSDQPVVIMAQNVGQALLSGDSKIYLRKCEYVVIKGFVFTTSAYSAIKLEACNNIRITRNTFRLTEDGSSKWVYIGGVWDDPYQPSHHNRIDHNLFENKSHPGNCITLDGSADPVYQASQYDTIDYNHFRNIGPRSDEMETIRVGWSQMSMSSAFCVIEYNLFESCDGDPEIISVKTCDNIIRYNTFRRCQGTLSLRHGHRDIIEGNFFLGDGKAGTGGIRLYGDDHKIYNNYFEGLTGYNWDAALTLTNGDAETGDALSEHWRINRAIIAFNTLVNNEHNIEIGFTNNGSYSKPPRDVVMANNLVVGSQNNLVSLFTDPVNIAWSGNIMYPMESATLGIVVSPSEILVADPLLVVSEGLWILSSASPAINASVGDYTYVEADVDGQIRDMQSDVGADEYSHDPIVRHPLSEHEVGPYASDGPAAIARNNHDKPEDFRLSQNYPNPFNPSTVIPFHLDQAGYVSLDVFNLKGELVTILLDQHLAAGEYVCRWHPQDLSSGIYLGRLFIDGQQAVIRMLYLK
ncbi:chondroitinase-B domain-containing protein [Candidatus Neomarinimicrobiota bacterium]